MKHPCAFHCTCSHPPFPTRAFHAPCTTRPSRPPSRRSPGRPSRPRRRFAAGGTLDDRGKEYSIESIRLRERILAAFRFMHPIIPAPKFAAPEDQGRRDARLTAAIIGRPERVKERSALQRLGFSLALLFLAAMAMRRRPPGTITVLLVNGIAVASQASPCASSLRRMFTPRGFSVRRRDFHRGGALRSAAQTKPAVSAPPYPGRDLRALLAPPAGNRDHRRLFPSAVHLRSR